MHETIRQSGLAEARHHDDHSTGSPDAAVEEVFLSPRVVDAAAFAEFAQSLRHLLVEAAQGRERLGQAIDETDSVVERLRGIASQAGEKLRPAVRLIPTIDQKLKQAEEALERASAAAEVAERTAGEAARAATAESVVALREAQEAHEATAERASGLEGSLREAIERAEATVAALDEESKTRAAEATERAQAAMDGLVAELDGKIEAASARLAAMLEERDAAAAMAMGRAIEIASDEQDTVGEKLESRVSQALDRAEAAAARAEAAEQQAAAAEARLSAAEGQLRAIDQRGREIADGASRALAMFDKEITSRMHALLEAMDRLGPPVDAPAETPVDMPEPPPAAPAPARRPGAEVRAVEPHAPEVQPERSPVASRMPDGRSAESRGYVRIDRPLA